ncbi:hypothetical protein NDU88_005181 [Pleurodeles waltl]|uniref:Endonuclease/exonuclease/phosphatase domain-containing protein n=1 Tax=Pleurodeles waltl TaxID=8319 RepID=A0AAV7SL48_PLEWA|nr:hypothetical protein NDU88_005181 [Pleurodeles waltl]
MSWNIAGAKAIITEGFTVMSSCNYSIIVLQETWLVDPIELGGYSLHHIGAEKSNKSGRASGGLATYISTALQVTTEQLAFSSTDLQAIKINFSFNRQAPLIIFNVYAHPRKHRKVLLFETLLQKVEEIRCANLAWDILVTGDFNSNLIFTPEPDEQLAAENAIWSVLPQLPSLQMKLDIRGKQLVEALEHLSMKVLNGRVKGLPEGSRALPWPGKPRPRITGLRRSPPSGSAPPWPDSHHRTNQSRRSSPQWCRTRSSISAPQADPPTVDPGRRALQVRARVWPLRRYVRQPLSARSVPGRPLGVAPVLLGAPPRLGGRLSQQDPGS